jgi:hypothetical protein
VICLRTFPAFRWMILLSSIIISAHQANAASKVTSISEYRTKLENLDQLLAVCEQFRDAVHCKGDQVTADVSVSLLSGPRQVHFGWLRDLLNEAAKNPADSSSKQDEKDSNKVATNASPRLDVHGDINEVSLTLNERLEVARSRLKQDFVTAGMASQNSQAPSSVDRVAARTALITILAAKEYKPALMGRSLKDRIFEKIGNWINTLIGKLVRAGSKARWIGITAEVSFVGLVCFALVWILIRLERQGRVNTDPFGIDQGSYAVSARDWQLWLQDARQAAAQSEWRVAIHLLYWASISRLESSGAWPADRARTPREYLLLLQSESPQLKVLVALTACFERTWYGGNSAQQADYNHAALLAGRLGAL